MLLPAVTVRRQTAVPIRLRPAVAKIRLCFVFPVPLRAAFFRAPAVQAVRTAAFGQDSCGALWVGLAYRGKTFRIGCA